MCHRDPSSFADYSPKNHPFLATIYPIADQCCFQCTLRMGRVRIDAMLDKLPPGAWENEVKPRLVVPVLRRLSAFDPLGRLPLSWIDDRDDGRARPAPLSGGTLVVVRYWDLCKLVREGPEGNCAFFPMLHSLASNIMHTLTVREPGRHSGSPAAALLWRQVSLFSGNDPIIHELRSFLGGARSATRRELRISNLADSIEKRGAVDYCLFIAQRLRAGFAPTDRRSKPLDALVGALCGKLGARAARRWAFAMALHRRSTGAAVRVLGLDLVRLCAVMSEDGCAAVLWEDVLGRWLVNAV